MGGGSAGGTEADWRSDAKYVHMELERLNTTLEQVREKAEGVRVWSNHALSEMERLNQCITDLETRVEHVSDGFRDKMEAMQKEYNAAILAMKIDINTLKVKSSVLGAISGAVIAALLSFLSRFFGSSK